MVARQTSHQGLKSVTGAILLALGSLVLFANLDAVASQIVASAGVSGSQTVPALILAGLHALQAYAFDHAGFLPGLLQILVSCWPLILIVVGAFLLRPIARKESWRQGVRAETFAASGRGDRR